MNTQMFLNSKPRALLRVGISFLFVIAASFQLNGQASVQAEAPTDDDEIVRLDPFEVTGSRNIGYGAESTSSSSRINMRYIDVPQTVNVVTSEFLADAHLYDSHDFVKFTPNIIPRTNTHQTEVFYIRGLQTGQSYVDGFLTIRASNRDAALLDRVEYVKGPASASMGRGEAAGLVNFVSKRPLQTTQGTYTATVGTDSFYRAELDYNTNITKDGKVSFRIPVYFEDADGTRSGDVMHIRKYGIGPSLLWTISPQTAVVVNTALFKYEGPGPVGEVYWSNRNIYDYQLERGQLSGSDWNPYAGDAFVPDDTIYGWAGDGRQSDIAEITVVATHKFTDAISYRQGIRYEDFEEEFRRFNLSTVAIRDPEDPSDFLMGISYRREFLTRQQWRLQGDLIGEFEVANSSHLFMVGWDWSDFSGTGRNGQRGGLSQSMYHPDYNLPAGFDPETYVPVYTSDSSFTGNQFGYYGQYIGNFLDDKIQVMAAWRKDQTEQNTHNNRNDTDTDTGTVKTDVPRYSISYKPTNNISIYYLHSEQADPPQTIFKYGNWSASAGATIPPPSDPRHNEMISSQVTAELNELGMKVKLAEDNLTASFAVYQLDRTGFLQHEFLAEPGSNGVGTVNYNRFFILSGEALSGVEFEVVGTPTDRLTLSAAVGMMKGLKPDVTGNKLPIESLIDSISFNARYDFRDRESNGFQATFGYLLYLDGWAMTPGTTTAFQGNQFNMDAGVSYSWSGGKYTANLRCNNLFDDLVYNSQNSQWDLRRVFLSISGGF